MSTGGIQMDYSGLSMSRKPKSQTSAKNLSVRQRAYLHIQRCIASGQLEAGSTISEVELARELGSSRTPVREALGQLVAEGLLEQSPTGGTLVVQLEREDIIDLYELREALEVYDVGKVVRLGVRQEELDRLQSLVDGFLLLKKELDASDDPALDPEQINRFIAYDVGFHARLMSMAQNFRMQKVINDTRVLIRIFTCYRRGHDAALLDQISREHQSLLDAVVGGDSELAMRLISEHIRTSQHDRLEDFDLGKREASIRACIPAFFDIDHSLVTR
jgi:DNA-binding GntR family transcriptional regulator